VVPPLTCRNVWKLCQLNKKSDELYIVSTILDF
jgi:hypothetical protein